MIRLYLRKLLLTIVFLALYFLFYLVVGFVWMRIASSWGFTIHPNLRFSLVVAISLAIELLAVYVLRIDNPKHKEAFDTTQGYIFSTDFKNTFKSAENLTHTFAYVTVAILFLVYTIAIHTISVGTVIAVLISCGLFTVVNTLLWTIIHKRWVTTAE